MISVTDLFIIIAALCLLALTVLLISLGLQVIQVLQDVKRISLHVEQISGLVESLAQVTFPGMQKVAGHVDKMEEKVAHFLDKKVDQLTKK